MCNLVSTFCSSIMPEQDMPYKSLTLIAVTCWHTGNGSVQSFVSGVGIFVGPSGVCHSFCAQRSLPSLRWQCVSPVSLSDVGF